MENAKEWVANQLRGEILAGSRAIGSRLPPERALAESLGVSRITLRSAIAQLQAEALIEVKHGSGAEVKDYRLSGNLDLFRWIYANPDLANKDIFKIFSDIIHLRQHLVIPIVMELINKVSEKEVEQLQQDLQAMKTNIESPSIYLEAHLALMDKLVVQHDNMAVQMLHHSLNRVIRQRPELILAFLGPLDVHYQITEGFFMLFMGDGMEMSPTQLRQALTENLSLFENHALERLKEYLGLIPHEAIQ